MNQQFHDKVERRIAELDADIERLKRQRASKEPGRLSDGEIWIGLRTCRVEILELLGRGEPVGTRDGLIFFL